MSDNLKVFDRVYVNVVGFKVKDENGNILTFTRGTPSQSGIIVPEQNVTASQAYTQIQFNKEIVVGEEYIVTINGTVKTITAQIISGSLLLVWGNGIYIEYANSSMYFDVLNSSQYGTYTVKVEEPSSSSPTLQSKTATPSESTQTITADSGYDGLSSVEIGAISSTYVGSGVARKTSTDLTASGATVTVPSGYYANQATKSVASGTEGTPIASKGTVSNHAISITPSVTNSEGYISGGTRTGNSVTVTARELVQGVTLYMDDGAGEYDVANAETFVVDEGTAGTPTASKGTVSNHSISVTPTVTNVSGYIDGGTITGTAVSVSASELVSGTYSVTSSGTKDVTNYASISVGSGTEGTPTATKGTVSNHSVSITPSVTNSGGYITGSTKTGTAVTISASELVSGSQTITENGTVNVTNLASVNVAIPVVTYYTGTSEPVASQYNDGDIYLKVVSN